MFPISSLDRAPNCWWSSPKTAPPPPKDFSHLEGCERFDPFVYKGKLGVIFEVNQAEGWVRGFFDNEDGQKWFRDVENVRPICPVIFIKP